MSLLSEKGTCGGHGQGLINEGPGSGMGHDTDRVPSTNRQRLNHQIILM